MNPNLRRSEYGKSENITISIIIIVWLYERTKTEVYPTKNIIIIVMDTVRPDRLSSYGYDVNTSPHIDDLARQGVIFTKYGSVNEAIVEFQAALRIDPDFEEAERSLRETIDLKHQ